MDAFKTGIYRNLFKEAGIEEDKINKRLDEIFNTFFYGDEDTRIYHEAGDDMGYLVDTGNTDVRTEGMSYGMMICVQLDKKEEFDRIWKWAYTYMWQKDGPEEGYFAWSCSLDGRHNSEGAAPDGEEFFAMSLFFASHRWGDGDGIFEYSKHARAILSACLHKGENGRQGAPMWNHDNKQVLFVAGCDFTDPSYHLPHFYELWALWANEEDRQFFKEAAAASRRYLAAACHKDTGMNAEYAAFDGSPMRPPYKWNSHPQRHDLFFSDSYRTAANIGLDCEWFGEDCGHLSAPARLITFLDSQPEDTRYSVYEIDGTRLDEPALHPTGMQAATTQGALAILRDGVDDKTKETAYRWIRDFFDTPLRQGDRRYYDNCLYMFAFLALSGNYRAW